VAYGKREISLPTSAKHEDRVLAAKQEDRILALKKLVANQEAESGREVMKYQPKTQARIDDFGIPAADLLRQLPGVARVEAGGGGPASSDAFVLLINDIVVTDAWLNQLVGLATMSQTVGMVRPMSNYAAPPQLVETVPYGRTPLP